MAELYAGEDVEVSVQWTDKDGKPMCPLPDQGCTLAVKSDDELTTYLAPAAAAVIVEEGGTAASATATTLVDTTKVWNVDQWKDCCIKLTGGTGVNQERRVKTNTATTLTLYGQGAGADTPVALRKWATNPDGTTTYQIHKAEYKRVWASLASLANTILKAVGTAKDTLYPNGITEKLQFQLEGAV